MVEIDTSQLVFEGEYGVHRTASNNMKMTIPLKMVKQWKIKHRDKLSVYVSAKAIVIVPLENGDAHKDNS